MAAKPNASVEVPKYVYHSYFKKKIPQFDLSKLDDEKGIFTVPHGTYDSLGYDESANWISNEFGDSVVRFGIKPDVKVAEFNDQEAAVDSLFAPDHAAELKDILGNAGPREYADIDRKIASKLRSQGVQAIRYRPKGSNFSDEFAVLDHSIITDVMHDSDWKKANANGSRKKSLREHPTEYLYHATLNSVPLRSFVSDGIRPSSRGHGGAGVYMATNLDATHDHVSPDQARYLRVKKQAMLDRFGAYPDHEDGLQYDDFDQSVLLGGNRRVPSDMVEYFDAGVWRPLSSKKSLGANRYRVRVGNVK